MQEILTLCVELDRSAQDTYEHMAEACADNTDLATVFRQMALEEQQHVGWWTELLEAWNAGLLPDLSHANDVRERLAEISSEIAGSMPESYAGRSVNDLLSLAARMEFFMLDPVFSELTELMQPGSRVDARKAYSYHVLRIVEAIERHHTEQGLASFLARVLKRSFRDQQQLALLATHDQLTRHYNRRGLMGHLEQWLSWSARYGHPVGIALIDLDHFKRINDTFGHPVGDEALVAVADQLRSVVRTSDIVGRFGGDEFMVIAPETGGADLAVLLDRIVCAVRETAVLSGESHVALTVSAGGAFTLGGAETSMESLIASADCSLYAAKDAGRDRAGTILEIRPTPVRD
jgi:diguanylate cyclase (GGDEF)-like protein